VVPVVTVEFVLCKVQAELLHIMQKNFILSASSMPLFQFTPLLSEVQVGKAWEPSNIAMLFRKLGRSVTVSEVL
jgi:hypothetical protein